MIKAGHSYDAIIIGGGHNGLVCAAYLAKSGKAVLVLEAQSRSGGMGASREFSPGFIGSLAQTLPQFTQKIVKDLGLKNYGFELINQTLPLVGLSEDGHNIVIEGDSVSGVNLQDQQAFQTYTDTMSKYVKVLKGFFYQTPPRIGAKNWSDTLSFAQFALKLRLMGKDDMREFLRVISLPAQDVMDENFSDDLLKSILSWDYNIGSKMAPRSPNHAVLNLMLRLSGDLHEPKVLNTGARVVPKGGMGGMMEALKCAAEAAGVTLKTSSPVKRVIVENHVASGVELASGQKVMSPIVISNADPKTSFFKLLGREHLEIQFTHRINRIRDKGMVGKLHLALDQMPEFTGLDIPHGRLISAPSMAAIERAFDAAKYGDIPKEPVMEIMIPSLYDPSLTPDGKHILSANVQYIPYDISGGVEKRPQQLMTNIMATLEKYAPGIGQMVLANELLTPKDIDAEYGVSGGHWHHGELTIDQWLMNRPTYGASQYKTPVPGFFLCGAGTHPGGGIMGAAGKNAAKEVMANGQ